MGNELDSLKEMLSNYENNHHGDGILVVKCGVLVLKNPSGQYQPITVEDGQIRLENLWLDEKDIKTKCMELNPEEYPMGETIYGD